MPIEISSTDRVPEDVLSTLVEELPDEFQASTADHRIALCSMEPPAWFTLIADLDWWIKILGGYAAIYLASITNAAGKETWEKRSEITSYIRSVTRSIIKAKSQCEKHTHAELAIKLPDLYYEAKLYLSNGNEEKVAKELALFIHYAPEVVKIYNNHISSGGKITGWVGLRILPNDSMEVNFMDGDTSDNVQHVLERKNS